MEIFPHNIPNGPAGKVCLNPQLEMLMQKFFGIIALIGIFGLKRFGVTAGYSSHREEHTMNEGW
jgi:hypothetical protein